MLPAHYAITEVLIVASSIYSIYLLKGRKEFFAFIVEIFSKNNQKIIV